MDENVQYQGQYLSPPRRRRPRQLKVINCGYQAARTLAFAENSKMIFENLDGRGWKLIHRFSLQVSISH